MDFFNGLTEYFNRLGMSVDNISSNLGIAGNRVEQVWQQGSAIINSLQALKVQIDSLTKFVHDMRMVMMILIIAIAIQFIVILWMWAGQSSIKKELADIKAAVKGQVTNGKQ